MFNKYCIGKRSIKCICTLINSPNQLYNQIVKYSLYNCTTIIGENVRYFMNKYDIYRDDWNSPINILYNKIDLYSTQHALLDDICVSTSLRGLCESRDLEYTNFFDLNESRKLIDFLLCVILLFLVIFYPLHLYVFVLICQYYVVLLERTNKDIIYNTFLYSTRHRGGGSECGGGVNTNYYPFLLKTWQSANGICIIIST